MAIYLTEQEYADYFGIDLTEVPSDFVRLELLSISLFNSIFPNIPQNPEESLSETCYGFYKFAIAEQIMWLDTNPDSKEGVSSITNSFSIGRYSATQSDQFSSDELYKRLSTNAYTFLDQCGLTYSGLGTSCTIGGF